MGLFLGPMLACMILAVTKNSISGVVMLVSMAGGVLVGALVATTSASGMWVSPVAFVFTISVAFLASWVFPKKPA